MRAEQTVSEMVVEVLARQAEALSEGSGRSFDEAFAEVLRTRTGRQLGELADGPHRHERAAEWQEGLLADRQAKRPAHLRESGCEEPALVVGGLRGTGEGRGAILALRNEARYGDKGEPDLGRRYGGPIRRSRSGAVT